MPVRGKGVRIRVRTYLDMIVRPMDDLPVQSPQRKTYLSPSLNIVARILLHVQLQIGYLGDYS